MIVHEVVQKEIRCLKCNKLLMKLSQDERIREIIYDRMEIKCPRCKYLNQIR